MESLATGRLPGRRLMRPALVLTALFLAAGLVPAATADGPEIVLWQIGSFDQGSAEFPSNNAYEDTWVYEANGIDMEPDFPGYLFSADSPHATFTARVVHIDFTTCARGASQLDFARSGPEQNDLALDGTHFASTADAAGAPASTLFTFDLGPLSAGSHRLTLTYAGGGPDDGNFVDALQLQVGPCLPGAVPALLATPGAGAAEVILSWAAASGDVTHYEIHRGTASNALAVLTSVPAPATGHTDTTGEDGVSYYYRVQAFSGQEGGTPSDTVSARTRHATQPVVYEEDFNDGQAQGWTLGGIWRVGDTCIDITEGTHALMLNQASTCNFDTGARVIAAATFSVDLTDLSTATLVYDEFIDIEQPGPGTGDPDFDHMRVEVSTDNTTWTTLADRSSSQPEQIYWTMRPAFDLDAYVGQVLHVRFHFDSIDALYQAGAGWALDLVQVRGTPALPQAPTGLTVTATDIATLTVAWDPPASPGAAAIDLYAVESAPGPDGPFTELLQTEALLFEDNELPNGATRTYRVRAHNELGWGPYSTAASGTTWDVPGAPSALSAVAGPGAGEVTLGWDAPATDGGVSIDGYRVYRDGALADDTAAPSFHDASLGNGATHAYEVAAFNAVGEGPRTEPASATTFDLPSAPSGLTAQAGPGAGEISLAWTAPSNGGTPIDTYRIHRDGALLTEVTTLAFTDTGLGLDATHTYTVSAVNLVGEGPQSDARAATTFGLPGAPTGLTVDTGPDAGEITLAWYAPASDGGSAITGYRITRGESSFDIGAATLHVDAGLDPGTTHTYTVAAMNAAGAGPATDPVTATTYDFADPPAGVTASVGPGVGNLTVAWGEVPDDGGTPVTGLHLYESADGETFTLLAELEPGTGSHLHTGLGAGATRTYSIAALNLVGEGPRSPPVSATTISVPEAPTSPVGASGPGFGDITLEFTEPPEGAAPVTHIQVHRGLAAGSLQHVATVALADLEPVPQGGMGASAVGDRWRYIDTGLGPGLTFVYAVSAVNSEGPGPLSAPFYGSTYTQETPPPPMPGTATLTSAAFDGLNAYIFGGRTGNETNGTSLDRVVRFDPTTESSTALDVPLPAARHATSAVWVPHAHETGRIFVLFGHDTGAGDHDHDSIGTLDCHPGCRVGLQILEFDPMNQQFEVKQLDDVDIEARGATASAYVPPVLDGSGVPVNGTGTIWVFGGSHVEDDGGLGTQDCHPGCRVPNQILGIDPETLDPSVIEMPPGVGARSGAGAVYVPPILQAFDAAPNVGRIYVFGGHSETAVPADDDGDIQTQDCHPGCIAGTQILEFNPTNQQVNVLPTQLPEERWDTSVAYDGADVYIFGGRNHTHVFNDILKFNPANGTIERVGDLPSGRAGTSAVAAGSAIYVFGGDDGNQTTDEVVRYRPLAPQGAEAEGGPGAGEVTVKWKAPSNALFADIQAYNVYAGPDAGNLTLAGTALANVRSFTLDTDPLGGDPLGRRETVFFKVSAVGLLGEGPQSALVNATTFDVPGVPVNLTLANDLVAGAVTLTWSAPPDDGGTPIVRYEVWRQVGPFGHNEVIPVGLATTFVDEECDAGRICEYKVRARNLVGPGDWTAVEWTLGAGLPF